MSHDAAWTNPSFLPDEIELEKPYRGNYTIPRIDSNHKENGYWPQGTEQPNSEAIPRAHYTDRHRSPGLRAQVSLKETTIVPVDESALREEPEEDYSLWSYFKCFKCCNRNKTQYSVGLDNKKSKSTVIINRLIKVLVLCAFIAYFIAVLVVPSRIQGDAYDENYWCQADGFLIIITGLVFTGMFYFMIFKPFAGRPIYRFVKRTFLGTPAHRKLTKLLNNRYTLVAFYVLAIGGLVAFLVIDTRDDRSRLISAFGIFVLLLIGFLFSVAPRKVVWRHVIWGMALQFIMGLIILRWSVGQSVFSCLGDKVNSFLKFTDRGSSFIFGELVTKGSGIFAFKVLSVILFFSFCIQILYYYGAMQWMVIKIGWLLQVTVGTTACESVNAAANIFLGQTEAPLLIKPYLPDMTKSELHAVMTGGYATIAGAVLAAYISFGVDPAHLLSASVMSAPAALAFAKLFYPETKVSKTKTSDIQIVKGEEANALHAAIEGVISAIPLVANIAVNLLAFIAFIAFVDAIFNWTCVLLDADDGVCSLSNLLGYVFMPLAWIMGVPWKDCYYVGQLIGKKTIVNEFVAYLDLADLTKCGMISKRAEIIATFALCGFSNISGIGIQVGCLGALAPTRKRDLSTIAVRAVIAGSIACFLTACVAGTLLPSQEDSSVVFNITCYNITKMAKT